jgi:hypothetical protein
MNIIPESQGKEDDVDRRRRAEGAKEIQDDFYYKIEAVLNLCRLQRQENNLSRGTQ